MTDIDRRRADEAELVSQMIALWCRAHHDGAEPAAGAAQVKLNRRAICLCPACAELRDYARARIERCPRMETKTFCSACPTHCYRPEMRERIREVMRWSGPRMLLHRPVPAIRHAITTIRSRKAKQGSAGPGRGRQ